MVRAVCIWSLFYLFSLPLYIYAQWSTSLYADSALCVLPGFSPNILTFDDGSSIISGTLSSYIYLQKLDEFGYRQWPNYVEAHHNDSTDNPGGTGLISDGDGGVILLWSDHRGAILDSNSGFYLSNAVYIQRVDKFGNVRWIQGGVQLAPALKSSKGGWAVADGAGGVVFIVIERSFGFQGATNTERLWATRYDSNGQRLWELNIDSSGTENTFFIWNAGRVGPNIFLQAWPINRSIDTAGNIVAMNQLPQSGFFVTDRDSICFWTTFTSQSDTINDSVYLYARFTKYRSLLDSIWSSLIPVYQEGQYGSSNHTPLVPDGVGGVYYVRSVYDDTGFVRTRIYHVDSLGNNIWTINQVYIPNFSPISAYKDDQGGIVLLNENRAVRYDYHGAPSWENQPITIISDPSNAYARVVGGDNNGGAIIAFWTLSGCIRVQHTGRNGRVGIVTSIADQSHLPSSFELYQNYPNPFNPLTVIRYQLSARSRVMLKVYDVLGQEVETLIDKMEDAGFKSVSFDANRLASGVYFYMLSIGNSSQTRKMLLIR